jgi:hypothetical protein
MAITGSLNTMSVSDLLQFLAVGKKTGLLKLSHAKVAKGIYFENGIIVGSITNDPSEYFGQVLLHYGKINESQLKAAMGEQRKDPVRLGQILIHQGVLPEAEVKRVLEIRTLEIIYNLFHWKEGHFEFYAEDPLPADFTRIHVEATRVVMEGVYRADELRRFQALIPSDRSILQLSAGWTSSLTLGKDTRQLLYLLEKRMSVAELGYNMHCSTFDIYGQLYELVKNGVVQVAGELPEIPDPVSEIVDLPEEPADWLLLAHEELKANNTETALSILHAALRREPKNTAAQALLLDAEKKFIQEVYTKISPTGVPRIVITLDELSNREIEPQEGFVLSRINGDWDIQSILSICPFREADSLRMIKKLSDDGIIGF